MTHPSRLRRQTLKKEFAVQLRVKATDAERKVWSILRNNRVAGLHFRRQQPIGPYIGDFFCSAAKLIIELDGGQHGQEQQRAHDEKRTAWLSERGYSVLRFANCDVLKDPQIVVEAIEHFLKVHGIPLPEFGCAEFDPPSRGG